MEMRTSNVPCSDLNVVWRMTWEDVTNGKYASETYTFRSELCLESDVIHGNSIIVNITNR